MRLDNELSMMVPSTLGEYRELCIETGGEHTEAVKFLDKKIARQGRESIVVVPHSQMLSFLKPMLEKEKGGS